jgi:hypothetical protein
VNPTTGHVIDASCLSTVTRLSRIRSRRSLTTTPTADSMAAHNREQPADRPQLVQRLVEHLGQGPLSWPRQPPRPRRHVLQRRIKPQAHVGHRRSDVHRRTDHAASGDPRRPAAPTTARHAMTFIGDASERVADAPAARLRTESVGTSLAPALHEMIGVSMAG